MLVFNTSSYTKSYPEIKDIYHCVNNKNNNNNNSGQACNLTD